MTRKNLEGYIRNDAMLDSRVCRQITGLRRAVDLAAMQLANKNRLWHDDPKADNHAEFHASTSEQFTEETRMNVVRALVEWHLKEKTI